MANTIQPDRQTVEQCLKNKTYYVDFYQRKYVWNEETVLTLLTDIFDVFEQSYLACAEADLTKECMEKNFNWYYLNVFITNKIDSKNYIVDGQQRLSTLTLICTKLIHLTQNQHLKDLLIPCICGKNWTENVYIIDHAKSITSCFVNTKKSISLRCKTYTACLCSSSLRWKDMYISSGTL